MGGTKYDLNEARFVRKGLLYAKGTGMMDVGIWMKE
jgi:hypothetical protein